MSAASTPFLDAALELARGGYYVFPCRVRGKAPATPNGWKDATRDETLIRDWWGEGANLNIGIACELSKIAVVDIDTKHGADPATVIPELGLDEYPYIKTGTAPDSGTKYPNSRAGERGAQIYTRAADLPTVDNIVPGVEIRGSGAYVIAPPSIHPYGDVYEGEIPPVAELPGAPAKVRGLVEGSEDGAGGGPLPPLPERIPAGKRHKTFHDYALSLVRKGFSEAGIAAALKAENHRCGEDPDHPEPLPEEEIKAIARDKARRFEPSTPGTDRTDRTPSEKPHGNGRKGVRSPTEHRPNTDRTTAPDLSGDPDLLARHDDHVGSMGLVGERHISRLTYLVHISRLLGTPGREVVKGDSSTGKSEAVRCALAAAAPEELFVRSQTSSLALFYTEQDLRHRTLVFYEANKLGDDDDPLAQVLRTLISEGELRYEVTDPKSHSTKLLEKAGPVAFVTTTTRAALDKEIETRILSLHSDNTDVQTERVVESILRAEGSGYEPDVDLGPWHDLDRWLRDTGPHRVHVPWAGALASFKLGGPPRLRRDIPNLLSLAKAHALLHRANRETDDRGRIVSTPDDYAEVCNLLADALAIATDKSVRDGTREIVEAVEALRAEDPERAISLRRAATKAGRAYSTTSTDVHDALERDYLVDRSQRDNAYDLDLGDPLPDADALLPTPEQLAERLEEGGRSGGIRSVFGSRPNTESRSQSQKPGAVRSVRSISEVEGEPLTIDDTAEEIEDEPGTDCASHPDAPAFGCRYCQEALGASA